MAFENQNPNEKPRAVQLPSRQLVEDLESVRDLAARAGHALTHEAETVSAIEWGMDQTRAAKMRDALSLSQEEHAELLERFRARNQQVWGVHSKTDW